MLKMKPLAQLICLLTILSNSIPFHTQGKPFVLNYSLSSLSSESEEIAALYTSAVHYSYQGYSETIFSNEFNDQLIIQSNSEQKIIYKSFDNKHYRYRFSGPAFFVMNIEEHEMLSYQEKENYLLTSVMKLWENKNIKGLDCYKHELTFDSTLDTLWTSDDIEVNFPGYPYLSGTPVTGNIRLERQYYNIELENGEVLYHEPRKEFDIPKGTMVYKTLEIQSEVDLVNSSFYIYGQVKNQFKLESLGNVDIKIYKNGDYFFTMQTDKKGNYHINLPLRDTYQFIYGNSQTIQKTVEFDFTNDDAQDAYVLLESNVDIDLFYPREDEDFSFLKDPIGYGYYDVKSNLIEYDSKKAKDIQNELEKILKKRM